MAYVRDSAGTLTRKMLESLVYGTLVLLYFTGFFVSKILSDEMYLVSKITLFIERID